MISGGITWMSPIKFGEPLECLCLGFNRLALSTPAGYVLATWLYVLATWLEKDPRAEEEDKQQKKRVGRDQRVTTADDKQSGLQKNGTTRFPAESNSVSRGDADTEFLYGVGSSRALVVTRREEAQVQSNNFMSKYGDDTSADRRLLRVSTDSTGQSHTMSITIEQFEEAIAAAADAAAHRAFDAITAQDAVSNRGAQSVHRLGVSHSYVTASTTTRSSRSCYHHQSWCQCPPDFQHGCC